MKNMKNNRHGGAKGVKAKKSFGQHFLKNGDIARVIARTVHENYVPALMPDGSLDLLAAGSLSRDAREFSAAAKTTAVASQVKETRRAVLEIGPGMGVLTQCLWEDPSLEVKMVEVDAESVIYLTENFPDKTSHGELMAADFLKLALSQVFEPGRAFIVTGNFPYNISSQILFKCLENRDRIPLVTGMFQKEVGERVCAKPGSKAYGILSVLLQAFYHTEYLFTVEPTEFNPPPAVRSCVIRLKRNATQKLDCDEKLFTALVKKAFNQRRKTLRNALKNLEEEQGLQIKDAPEEMLSKRAEQLSVQDYITLTQSLVREAHD